MPKFRLSRLARLDLIEIADYTQDTWGSEQAERYLESFEDCLKLLVEAPEMGRKCSLIGPGIRRIEHRKHVVFYRVDSAGIFVTRILHQRMLPKLRKFEE